MSRTATASSLTYRILPADQGQIVEIAYAVDWESETLYRRTTDRSDGGIEYASAPILGGEFHPQNGELPDVGSWSHLAAR